MKEKRNRGLIVGLIMALAVVAAIGALVVYLLQPQTKLTNALKTSDIDARVSKSAQIVQTEDPSLGEDAQAFINEAMEKHASSPLILDLALTANHLAEQGLDAEFAAGCIDRAMEAVDYGAIGQKNRRESFNRLLHLVPEQALPAILERTTAKTAAESLVSLIINLDRELPISEVTSIAAILSENGYDGEKYFIENCPELTLEMAADMLAEADASQLERKAVMLAEAFADTPDALAFMRECKALGVNPSVIYPDGIVLDMNLVNATAAMYGGDLHEADTYLVISRTEQDEPVRWRAVSPILTNSGLNPVLPGISGGGNYPSNFDANDKSDPANYTVKLETSLMDEIPHENLPASLEECSYMILLDTIYLFEGTITETTTMNSQVGRTKSAAEYPVYACQQSAWICASPDWDYLYMHDYIQTSPPAPPAQVDPTSIFFRIENYLQGDADEEWAVNAANEITQGLAGCDWSIVDYLLSMY